MAVNHRALGAADERSNDRVGFARIADFETLGNLDKPVAEHIEDRLFDQNTRIRHADLALMEENPKGRGPDGIGHIRVGEHDQRALAAHLQCEFFQRPGRLDREMPAGLRRAGKGDHPNPWIGEDCRTDFRSRSGYHA